MGPHRFWGRFRQHQSQPLTSAAVAAFLDVKRAAGRKPKTIEKLTYGLGKLEAAFPGDLPYEIPQLVSYFAGLRTKSDLSETTYYDLFHWTQQFYAFVKGRYGLPNPFDVPEAEGGLSRPKLRPKVLPAFNKSDVFRLMAANAAYPQRVAALALMLDTGIRPGEAYGLRREDIRGGEIVVRGKVGERRVPLSRKAREALLRWMMQHGGSKLWTQESQRGFVLMLKRAFKDAGVKGTPYMLRHTTATIMNANGASAFDVQRQLGHSTTRMTERYIAQSVERQAEAQRRFGPLADWEECYQQLLNLLPDEEPESP